ncbi:MAG: 30S ribosomal protein S4 [Candidatus Diapherotrites archaeon]|nr:30S ribosomal protein S4 [Candidatus Diapherotrites archaeon]
MGDPRKPRKKYSTPSHPYEKDRIEEENTLIKGYGLKNKREIWKAESQIRKYRTLARQLQADRGPTADSKKTELVAKLMSIKLVGGGATLDDVLGLTVTNFLDRRLQTIVFKKGLATTPKQARQFIVHGIISVSGRKVTVPGYVVTAGEEEKIGYYGKAPQLKPPEAAVAEAPVEKAPETKPSVPVPETKPSVPVPESKPSTPKEGSK